MTRVFNETSEFAEDVLRGITAAYPRYVQRVFGGVVRSTQSPPGEVAVVIGGGSGHYPAFSGWVGTGMAHGAVQGNVFASPSASQVYSVCRAADNGAGILLTFGNYAGDVLHFGRAAARLRAEGYDVRVLPVTDDVASSPANQPQDRRGVCGDLVVFKIAAAAAERGRSLDEVEAVAIRANARTRSLGVAFDGCTLPGAAAPLFTVKPEEMSVGLGVHGEPGVREVPMGRAAEIADLLVDGVLAEEPERAGGYAGRAVVLLNGLGTVKYEELLVVYGRVAQRLQDAGIDVVMPEVGELMTSLDMAGLSLTVCFLDAELEELWRDPVETIALRRGGVAQRPSREATSATDGAIQAEIVVGTPESQESAKALTEALDLICRVAAENEADLGRMDAIAGDGDHGQGMVFGSAGAVKAAAEARAAGAGARSLMIAAGERWAESAGGTSGALWGAALTSFGGRLSDTDAVTSDDLVAGAEAAAQTILDLGGAQVGDKTMVDALVPFIDTLSITFASTGDLRTAWSAAAAAATSAAQRTASYAARRGRSRVLGDKSLGTPDPGATSFALLMSALAAGAGASNPTESGEQ